MALDGGEASQIKVGILGGNDRRWRRNGGDEIVTSLRFSCLMFPFEYVRSDRNNVFLLVFQVRNKLRRNNLIIPSEKEDKKNRAIFATTFHRISSYPQNNPQFAY